MARFAPSALECARPVINLLERAPRRPGTFIALTWHRIDHPDRHPDRYPGLLSATPEDFATQVTWIANHRPVVRASEVVAAVGGGPPLPPGAVLLTFDDAADDLVRHIWPLLKSLGLPGLAFVPTGFPDQPGVFWWDQLWSALHRTASRELLSSPIGPLDLRDAPARAEAFRNLRGPLKAMPAPEAAATVDGLVADLGGGLSANSVPGWNELRRLAADGLDLAPHSRTHAMLNQLPVEAVYEEVAGSWADLRDQIPEAVPLFAYPAGQVNAVAVEAVRAAGLVGAFGTTRGHNRVPGTDQWRWRRVNVGRRTTVPALRAQLLPAAGALWGHRDA
jgi:peptidoglycan/xylan/chitin deacetylase (PgdA/CDA1 family)